jgi:hypothetical protein
VVVGIIVGIYDVFDKGAVRLCLCTIWCTLVEAKDNQKAVTTAAWDEDWRGRGKGRRRTLVVGVGV